MALRIRTRGFSAALASMGPSRERRIRILAGRSLVAAANMIRSHIAQGSWFDKPTGRLQGSILIGRPQHRGQRTGVTMYWGVPYGHVLEFGPGVKTWVIRAKNAKALRFESGGEIVYRRKVTHVWTPKQLRPHFAPTLKTLRGRLDREFALILPKSA